MQAKYVPVLARDSMRKLIVRSAPPILITLPSGANLFARSRKCTFPYYMKVLIIKKHRVEV